MMGELDGATHPGTTGPQPNGTDRDEACLLGALQQTLPLEVDSSADEEVPATLPVWEFVLTEGGRKQN